MISWHEGRYLERVFKLCDYPDDARHRHLIVAHLFDDTARMLRAMEPAVVWGAIVGIPYSSDRPGVLERWRAMFGDVVEIPKDIEGLEMTLRRILARELDLCRAQGRRLIVQDVGGFVAPMLMAEFSDRLDLVAGVVEITKQGVWRAEAAKPTFPVLHCATSEMKRFEAVRCGETVVRCIDGVARKLGFSLAGLHAIVVGAGWIGGGVVRALRRLDMTVEVVDTDPIALASARLDGCVAGYAPSRAEEASLVIGAAGRTSIGQDLLDALPDGAMIASASSRRFEIDMSLIDGRPVVARIEGCAAVEMADGRRIWVINDGYPANFMPGSGSVADEVVETILAELIVLQARLARGQAAQGVHAIDRADEALCAREWLAVRDAARPRLKTNPDGAR